MAETELQERIWTALAAHPVYMVSLIAGDGIRTRPMAGEIDRERHRILFVTHRHTGIIGEALRSPTVSIALSHEDRNFYAAVTCSASEIHDHELLRQIWTPMANAWFPNGPDDPDATLLALTPVSAEIWDGPSSSVLVAFKLATARILGRTPDLGVNATIDMR
ncbi:pyridoxamine 5'-phosphate oxidase family protein [Bosea sp. BH3]|uniref:pyridoxamine 5'-phosphate oxidase family protein n=1 Tax=Bosea sp. BH3 TaxID=2871701 RepID=UPI0021CB127F|nr:pyridoxamine 5'-phosphate oxidase family protein [Bosea sp. BH3]MCU4179189.1 pyridoxamine 5'-phosphate oxidase family protein [Bosea sp. BH3]